jgi:hypothetical protein
MSYFNRPGLGALIERSQFQTTSVQVESEQKAISDPIVAVKAEEAAFLASMPRCNMTVRRPDGSSSTIQGYLFTHASGKKSCVRDPLATRKLEAFSTVTVKVTMPFYNTDGSIRQGYLDLLLKAQGMPGNQVAAQNAGVDWYAGYMGKSAAGVTPVLPSEMLGARLMMLNALYSKLAPTTSIVSGVKPDLSVAYKKIADARGTSKEQDIKLMLAKSAYRVAKVLLPKQRLAVAAGKNTSTHFPQDCMTLGLPALYLPCCANAITRGGHGIESYREAIEKQNPDVMQCFHEAQAEADAKNKGKLVMVAGAVAAVVVGAALLKRRRGK